MGGPEGDPCVRRFRAFVLLWSAGTLLHQGFHGRLLILDPTAPLSFAALYTLLRPGSLPGFVLVLALQLAVVVKELPWVPNHVLLMGVSSAGLLMTLVPVLRRPETERVAALRDALGAIRAQIGIVYLWAAFHKINAGFLDSTGSCAARPLGLLGLGATPARVQVAACLALVAEGTLPLLLWSRRTRKLALLAGWSLHLLLGWRWAWDFSSAATAYYAAFAPASLFAAWSEWRSRGGWFGRACAAAMRFGGWRFAYPLLAGSLGVSFAWGALRGASMPTFAERKAAFGPWLVLWLALGAVLVRLVWASRGRPEPVEARARWRHAGAVLTVSLVALNGISPYVGLSTEHSFAMFSNLRTEADEWNHYLVPRAVRVFGFQDELVRLVDAGGRSLRREIRLGLRMVPFELRRWAAWHPQERIVYARGDRETRVDRAADDPFLAPSNPVLTKLLSFREVPPEGAVLCLH